ncbi:MAG: tetratricopeptide repeat protein [Terrimicrobiaceae bacterium]|nr:tetratricopeptide repeat protein [Terrimicrobiaceae bacterium]
MAVKTEKDLPESHRATWLKALSALQLKNYGYVIQLLQGVLKQEPEFLAGRQILRKAEVSKAAAAGKKSLLSGASFSSMKISGMIKKDALGAIVEIEKLLESEPHSPAANLMLRDAAMAANMPETATFALETIVQGAPRDTKMLHELAKHYVAQEVADKAVEVYTRITEINPTDLLAIKSGKDAAARASMKRGGWEKEGSTYRDLMRDKEGAVSLEQQGRVVRSVEMIDQQLAELGPKYEENPQNVEVARKIAELYEQKEDLEKAVQWFTYAAGLTGNTDSALVRKATDLRVKQYDASIEQYETYLAAADPAAPETAQYREQLDAIRRDRAGLELQDAKSRIERNPTDLMLRFELGDILVRLGEFKDAIPELQKARQNPNVRLRAMNLLGKCFVERNMLDLAAKTLEDASSELLTMDNVKKDIVYNLGLVYEKMGDKEKSIAAMKQIYEVDYGYKDVAERVEGSYAV